MTVGSNYIVATLQTTCQGGISDHRKSRQWTWSCIIQWKHPLMTTVCEGVPSSDLYLGKEWLALDFKLQAYVYPLYINRPCSLYAVCIIILHQEYYIQCATYSVLHTVCIQCATYSVLHMCHYTARDHYFNHCITKLRKRPFWPCRRMQFPATWWSSVHRYRISQHWLTASACSMQPVHEAILRFIPQS